MGIFFLDVQKNAFFSLFDKIDWYGASFYCRSRYKSPYDGRDHNLSFDVLFVKIRPLRSKLWPIAVVYNFVRDKSRICLFFVPLFVQVYADL